MRALFTNARIVTLGPDGRVIDNGDLLVENGRIAQLGPSLDANGAERVDCGGRLIMPGQINAHDHLYSALARGIALKDEPPQNFLQILQRLWWRLDAALNADDVYYSGLLGFIEAARTGTTSIIDHHASPSFISGSLDALAKGSRQVGLRGCFCYEVTDRNGEEGGRLGVEENVRFLRANRNDEMVSGAFGLHASITVNPELLKLCLAQAPSDCVWHVHVAEDGCDVEHSLEHYGKPPLQRLIEEGLDGRRVLAAHCIHLKENEIEMLARQKGFTVQHNPRSNMNNAVGCAPVKRLLDKGVRVCLGTDGMSQDPGEDFRQMTLVHKLVANHPQAFGWGDAYRIGYLNNADLAGEFFGVKVGVLEPGAAADLRIVDYDPPTPLDAGNVLGHMLFGLGTAPVWATVVGGRFIYRDGRVLGVNEKEVMQTCRELASKLWERW